MRSVWEASCRSYEWDDDERLLSVEWTEHERLVMVDPGRLENVYDADGHRIESTETQNGESTTTQYLVDESGWLSHVVAEIRDGEVVTHYQRAGDQLLGLVREGSTADRYFHLDGLGSVRGLTDSSGSVTDRYEYTAYGERLEEGTDPQPYGFTGEPWSSVMELAHHRARWMDPAMGRFLSVDPWIGDLFRSQSLHMYRYTANNPLTEIDQTGLFGTSVAEFSIVNSVRLIGVTIQGDSGFILVKGLSEGPSAALREILNQAVFFVDIFAATVLVTAIGRTLRQSSRIKLNLFEKLGIETTTHFRNRLASRRARGITEESALEAYTQGRLYYNTETRNYIRHSSRTKVSVVTDAPSGR